MTATCHNGHPLTPDNVTVDARGWRTCRTCQRVWRRRTYDRRWNERHAGHTIVRDRAGSRRCRTCRRRYRLDVAAVERAMGGDPPARLTPAERAEAVLRLRSHGLPGTRIAERVGCAERTVWRILRHASTSRPP